ncbi:MAG: hypothetical protein L6R38_007976 [Xanthoria sp. 2 TBL-2021]|nr:MAG: hypothetical protein L6R38_007976 [Xanthoria sp. 2 TBL-2021]
MVLQITPADIAYQKAHKDDDRSGALYATAATMIVLPTIAVVLRLACRRHLQAPISHDDIAIIVALVLCWGICVMIVLCGHFGTGRHTMTNPIPHVVHFIQLMYAVELTYTVLITTTKFSILLFYRRVFISQATSLRFRIVWYAITVWTFLWGISTFFAAAFQCSPASFYWSKYTRKTQGTCMDLRVLLLVTASLNIVTDVALLILPMPVVWNLKIERSQKFAVSGIFLLGGLSFVSVCVASIIRAPYLNQVVTVDPQWTSVNASIWSVIEPGVGIICASLPSMGPILRKAFPLQSLNREPRNISLHSSQMAGSTAEDPEKQQTSGSSSEVLNNNDAGQRSSTTVNSTLRNQSRVEAVDVTNNNDGRVSSAKAFM